MSDNWIALIPQDPWFLPAVNDQQAAVDRLSMIAPDAEEIEVKVSEKIQFFDCGSNLKNISCPSCGAKLGAEWWQERLDEDYSNGGFQLQNYPVPCCAATSNLDKLRYDWPQGFARFGIDVMNPNIEELSDDQIRNFEALLKTSLRVIYQHI